MPLIFATTTRGLEDLGKAEMSKLGGLEDIQTSYRRISAYCESITPSLLSLQTIEDLFVFSYHWKGISHKRDALTQVRDSLSHWNLEEAVRDCACLRRIENPRHFSVSVSFVGKRNYSSIEFKNAVSEAIQAKHHWTYYEDERESEVNVRIFIEHGEAFVGVRLGSRPLHERSYKLEHRLGALKPSIAACLLKIAGVQSDHHISDPCCGTGTIPIEAAMMGCYEIVGGDINQKSLLSAWTNSIHLKEKPLFIQWDAQSMPIRRESLDRIVSNFPWGRQIKTDNELHEFYLKTCSEVDRVLKPRGLFVCLTTEFELLNSDNLKEISRREISLHGQRPNIVVFEKT